ncbi:MAG TPA: tetratricopeptide repeat protein [Xanthobacteraceae bacterium]|nr:tetratricopeptide repeat protein [Xanthobacteraceae bacterium]
MNSRQGDRDVHPKGTRRFEAQTTVVPGSSILPNVDTELLLSQMESRLTAKEGEGDDSLFGGDGLVDILDRIFGANTENLRDLVASAGLDSLEGLVLQNANLRGQDLTDLDFSGVDLSGADLSNTDLRGAKLNGAILNGTKFNQAKIDESMRALLFEETSDPTMGVAEETDAAAGSDPALADEQALLTCFAPFSGVINTQLIENYREALAKEPAVAGLPLDRLGEVLERACSLGLLQRDAKAQNLLRPQPALNWFLTGRLAAADQNDSRQAIERAFRKLYDGLARALSSLQESNEPTERQLGQAVVELEYANFGTALRLALDQEASIRAPYIMLSGHLDHLQDHRRGRELDELVLKKLEQLPREALTGQRGTEFVGVIDNIGERQLRLRELDAAQASYKKALAIHYGLQMEPRKAGILRAGILHQLGRVAQEQHNFEEAEAAYKEALEIYGRFNDRYEQAGTYHQLGAVAQKQGRFDDAEAAYKKALEIKLAFNDRHSAAATYHQLGMVAQEQRRFEEAEAAYNNALEIYISFSDRHAVASSYHRLGAVAEEQRQFDDAEAAYKKALEIYVSFNYRYEQFEESSDAAIVLQSMGRLKEKTGALGIPSAVATILNIEIEQAKGILEDLGRASTDRNPDEPDS